MPKPKSRWNAWCPPLRLWPRELVQGCLQSPTAHHERHPLLPVGVLREAPHEENLAVPGLERNGLHVLWPILHPVGHVAPRLRQARAIEGEDPHHRLDRTEKLLLEVSQLVQRPVRGAKGHVVVASESPRLWCWFWSWLCTATGTGIGAGTGAGLLAGLHSGAQHLVAALHAHGSLRVQPVPLVRQDKVHEVFLDVVLADAFPRRLSACAEPPPLAVVASVEAVRRKEVVDLRGSTEDPVSPLRRLARLAVELAHALGQSALVAARDPGQVRLAELRCRLLPRGRLLLLRALPFAPPLTAVGGGRLAPRNELSPAI